MLPSNLDSQGLVFWYNWRVAEPMAFDFSGAALFAGYAKGALFCCARLASTSRLQPLALALRAHIANLSGTL